MNENAGEPSLVGTDVVEQAAVDGVPADEVLADEVLVEEVSIDGMCGVY